MTFINNECTKGIVSVSYSFFRQKNKWMRQMNQITYRLLSLILYSLLHFANMLNFITTNTLKTMLTEEKTCFYIKSNWEILSQELIKLNINNPYIFLNMIFSDIETAISQHSSFNTKEERNAFEQSINNIVINAKERYSNFTSSYSKQNSDIIKIQ